MKRSSVLLLGMVVVATCLMAPSVQTAQTGQKKWPPMFPRAGAQKLFENERVIVTDDLLPTEHHMHQHVLDSIYFYIDDGPIESVDENGKISSTSSEAQKGPRFGGFTKAGRGPHSERSLDPNKRRRMFRVEFKGTQSADCREWSTDPICR